MTNIPSPYRDAPTTIALQTAVASEDYLILFRMILPFRGAQKAVMAQLFQIFFNAVQTLKLQPFDLQNERTIINLLARFSTELQRVSLAESAGSSSASDDSGPADDPHSQPT